MFAAVPLDEKLSSLEEVSSLVLAAEGILSEGVQAELSRLSHSSDEGILRASAEIGGGSESLLSLCRTSYFEQSWIRSDFVRTLVVC